MALFYKGVGPGTHHSSHDLRLVGLNPRNAGLGPSPAALVGHIAHGTTHSAYVSITRSYGVAAAYAFAGTMFPSAANPGHIYEIDIPDPVPTGLNVIDPIFEIGTYNANPVAAHSYHHAGDQNFLLGIIDPVTFAHELAQIVKYPPSSGAIAHSPTPSLALQAIVRAARDAEILVCGTIPAKLFVNRFDVY